MVKYVADNNMLNAGVLAIIVYSQNKRATKWSFL